ncbi:hypothetical protein LCGC14_2402140 [marine sediment metagenome]|uniref:Uncharacterized protein n=1 Tax=marine sediment metagenome TaxID=412755 RepID=A0A0F9BV28_9ZZZZ
MVVRYEVGRLAHVMLGFQIGNLVATPIGFEPTISSLTSWHVNRYTTGPPVEHPRGRYAS